MHTAPMELVLLVGDFVNVEVNSVTSTTFSADFRVISAVVLDLSWSPQLLFGHLEGHPGATLGFSA